jgi:hypothetical protein
VMSWISEWGNGDYRCSMGLLEWDNALICPVVKCNGSVELWVVWVASLAQSMTFERRPSYVKWA